MAEIDHNVISGLLLMVLTFVLAMSILIVYLIMRLRHRSAEPVFDEFKSTTKPSLREFPGEKQLFFRRPDCWLAVRNGNVPAVQSALALHNVKPCSWVDGLAGDTDEKLFISPPVSGWVLVIGSALPDPCDDEDACFRFLLELSRKLGHVQLFSMNGVVNQHAWARAEAGRVLRAYAWAGRTLWNQGEATEAEHDLGMRCYDYSEGPEHPLFGGAETGPGNSDKVHLLAARWSIDPEQIDERFIGREWGIQGKPTRDL
jgi:hypothetical protein